MVVRNMQWEVTNIPFHIFVFDFQMIYNAQGEVLKPFIAHSGEIPNAVQEYYGQHIKFSKTDNGKVDQCVLIEVCQYLKK